MNENTTALKKAFKVTAVIMTVILLIMTVFFAVILTVLAGSFDSVNSDVSGTLRFIRVFILIGGPAVTVIADIALYRSYKSKTRLMSEVKPLECAVEDFLISSYYRNRKRSYKITPVLRDLSTNELYCAFGIYDMSFYASSWSRGGGSLNINILRSDGSAVELGDSVRVYVKRFVEGVNVETDGNRYAFDGRWREFHNINQSYGMEMLHALRFFEGIVDVERH